MKLITRLLVLALAALCAHASVRAQQPSGARLPAWQVVRHDLAVTIDAAQARSITVRATVAARNVGDAPGRTFTVRLNPEAVVTSAAVDGATATFEKRTDERAKLQMAVVNLPAPVAPGGTVSATVEYRIAAADNTSLAAVSAEGAQFLPVSFWYPTPNTPIAPRGADYAPYKLSVTGLPSELSVISSGKTSGAGAFEQTLNAQPFFLAGRWDAIEGAGEAAGVSAHVNAGASPDERKRAEDLIALASAARSFYAGLLGPATDAPVRLVSVRRGAGFDAGGTLLLDESVFRRAKTDAVTALAVAEAVARLWVGGATPIGGDGASVMREGLPRYLASLFIEKQFGREAAEAERARISLLYAQTARADAPLSQVTPAFENYFPIAANKGSLAWRVVAEHGTTREAFLAALRRELETGRTGAQPLRLASLRAALGERTDEPLRRLLEGLFDQPTDTDLVLGLPHTEGAQQVSNAQNRGSYEVATNVAGTTERGERLNVQVRIPAKGMTKVVYPTAARITHAEIDPAKHYPQVDFSNDTAPWSQSVEDALAEARTQFAQRQLPRTEELTRAVLRRAPLMHDARALLGRALLEQNKLDEAAREFSAVAAATLPSPSALAWASVGLGEIAMRRNQPAEAARHFDAAVRADAEYASTLAARAGRLRAETAATSAPAADEAVRAAAAQLDAAIRSGKKVDLDAVVLGGELRSFERGIIGSQPEVWETRVLRTESLGGGRFAADVEIKIRAAGVDQAGTAVLVFTRTAGGLRLADIRFFEVRPV
ncbi:MAG TPA: hypothetical protein VFX96_18320 [Pyrinomonadaceae bacterium]|nr:hypothetical protein [Pyrinomonadaceae bacterium]